jgi:predicted dehydrogenase
MTRPLSVLVQGFGARGPLARLIEQADIPAQVAAVVDPDPQALERARRAHPAAARFRALDQALASGLHFDAAFILTPDGSHERDATDLLGTGIPVYLEKPMALNARSADAIVEAAGRAGVPAFVGHNFRRSAVIRTLKSVIDQGLIGEVKTIWVRHFVGHGGDYYFRDWHADRSLGGGLLLQKGSHDIDAIHYLAGAFATRVSAMGSLMVYGDLPRHAAPQTGIMPDWFSLDHWPPDAQTGLNPVVDVEDVSLVNLELANGVLASYSQCHFSPDYWRNYTVIGTRGRVENFGDTGGGVVRGWNRRREWDPVGDFEIPLAGAASGHNEADQATVEEFLRLVADGGSTREDLLAARQAVAACALATETARRGSVPLDVPLPGAVFAPPSPAPGGASGGRKEEP